MKKCFNGCYLAEVHITLAEVKFQRLFKNLSKIIEVLLTIVKFQRFILKPQLNNVAK